MLVKMELLDNKHAEVVSHHLQRLLTGLQQLHDRMIEALKGPKLFPVEVDLTQDAFQYKCSTPFVPVSLISISHPPRLSRSKRGKFPQNYLLCSFLQETDDDELIEAEEVDENSLLTDLPNDNQADKTTSSLLDIDTTSSKPENSDLIPDLFSFNPEPSMKSVDLSIQPNEILKQFTKDNSQDLLIPDLETLSICQVEPDYEQMDNATVLAGLSLGTSNSSQKLISTLDN